MNPIPLTMPDGTVRSWCCGVCLSVPKASVILNARWTAEDIAEDVERMRPFAEKCCRCTGCSAPLVIGEMNWWGMCETCTAARVKRERWQWFCEAWPQIAREAATGAAQVEP